MLDIRKMSRLLLRINLPQIFTICRIKLSEYFPENIIGRVILVYNRYAEQPVYYLSRRWILPPVFSGKIFED